MVGDPTLAVFRRLFADDVDESIWTALEQDERPIEEVIDGPFADLVDDMFAVVATGTVVKFAPGLRPGLKSDSGGGL
jgi:hypothetical protein